MPGVGGLLEVPERLLGRADTLLQLIHGVVPQAHHGIGITLVGLGLQFLHLFLFDSCIRWVNQFELCQLLGEQGSRLFGIPNGFFLLLFLFFLLLEILLLSHGTFRFFRSMSLWAAHDAQQNRT